MQELGLVADARAVHVAAAAASFGFLDAAATRWSHPRKSRSLPRRR
jgi:hypothetical protein